MIGDEGQNYDNNGGDLFGGFGDGLGDDHGFDDFGGNDDFGGGNDFGDFGGNDDFGGNNFQMVGDTNMNAEY